MKYLRLLLLLVSLGFVLGACKDDETMSLDFDSLKQTQWSGTLYRSDKNLTFQVGLVFYTENEGKYSLKYIEDPYERNFTYTIDEKLMVLDTGDPDLTGNWLLIKRKKNQMTWERGTGGAGAKKSILTLTRQY